uniref:Putative secreted peptide n=1 Tax=Anopheles braziliensis TaxID=58242 RepID=A0A2M3ZVV3_9DIPT
MAIAGPGLPSFVLLLQSVADQLERFPGRNRGRADPALHASTGMNLHHVGRIDTDVQAEDQRHADRFHALLDAPALRRTVDTLDLAQMPYAGEANR